jgi:hypothetical protein
LNEKPEIGARVRAVKFCYRPGVDSIDDNVTVPPGTEGTVHHFDDAGTIFVKWDNGSSIGLLDADEWENL